MHGRMPEQALSIDLARDGGHVVLLRIVIIGVALQDDGAALSYQLDAIPGVYTLVDDVAKLQRGIAALS